MGTAGRDGGNIVIKAARGKWHFDLEKATNVQLGFRSLTLQGDRPSNAGGVRMNQSRLAMDQVTVDSCGRSGVLLEGIVRGGDVLGHFTDTTLQNNTRAMSITRPGGSVKDHYGAAAVFYGTTQVLGNRGGLGLSGPGFTLHDAKITFRGPAVFKDNIADTEPVSNGGAIYASFYSEINFTAPVTFSGNRAAFGGAIYLHAVRTDTGEGDSVLTATSTVTFENNTATVSNGGAIALGSSRALFDGECTFLQNTAAVAGGAIYASNLSYVALSQPVAFRGNKATTGGGIYMDTDSRFFSKSALQMRHNQAVHDPFGGSMEQQATAVPSKPKGGIESSVSTGVVATASTLTRPGTKLAEANAGLSMLVNRASATQPTEHFRPGCGGALVLSNRVTASFSGLTSFQTNTATTGGAVCALNSQIIIRGPTEFTGNVAGDAGALFITAVSPITATNTVTFADNHATSGSGGAMVTSQNVKGRFTQPVRFKHNSAATGSAGALFAGDGSVLRFDSLVEFHSNSAGTGGAVILLASNTSEIRADDAMHFMNNSAVNAGALLAEYASGSTGALRVKFLLVADNSAERLAGGLAVGCILEVAGHARFVNNIAGESGGALTVLGSATLHKACFISNKAATGAAMSVSGSVDLVTDNGLQNFFDNTDLDGGNTSTINIQPYKVTGREASITCNGQNPRPADSKSGKRIVVNGPLCDNNSCPPDTDVCSCPGGVTKYDVTTCSCAPPAGVVGITLSGSPVSDVSDGKYINFFLKLQVSSGTVDAVHYTVQIPNFLKYTGTPKDSKYMTTFAVHTMHYKYTSVASIICCLLLCSATTETTVHCACF